ncbi:hypothetical protein POSPLADRAFT_1032132 [Postia placenta MAD-698-R-SB12]|uniref:Uncharacterized protein n=1 Tax=Postia placenta MAD-698-R-SB12 TaxID=670580 RepID=A0A1X6N9V0_9APHY|nr:hypothetical protein POSPLADRAFT_1032132 [Postia placenta MAD-698-R-SB12]OSX65344.1 hypothetical protein POSPLADRAFT_1032132 [Postia placenta MAD-698-R-SB12]
MQRKKRRQLACATPALGQQWWLRGHCSPRRSRMGPGIEENRGGHSFRRARRSRTPDPRGRVRRRISARHTSGGPIFNPSAAARDAARVPVEKGQARGLEVKSTDACGLVSPGSYLEHTGGHDSSETNKTHGGVSHHGGYGEGPPNHRPKAKEANKRTIGGDGDTIRLDAAVVIHTYCQCAGSTREFFSRIPRCVHAGGTSEITQMHHSPSCRRMGLLTARSSYSAPTARSRGGCTVQVAVLRLLPIRGEQSAVVMNHANDLGGTRDAAVGVTHASASLLTLTPYRSPMTSRGSLPKRARRPTFWGCLARVAALPSLPSHAAESGNGARRICIDPPPPARRGTGTRVRMARPIAGGMIICEYLGIIAAGMMSATVLAQERLFRKHSSVYFSLKAPAAWVRGVTDVDRLGSPSPRMKDARVVSRR